MKRDRPPLRYVGDLAPNFTFFSFASQPGRYRRIEKRMTSRPEPELVPERYTVHVESLRAFFTSRGQQFGAPEDLFSLAGRLSTPGSFHADMSSLLRTVVSRGNAQMTREELLDLVRVAIGGTESLSTNLDVEVPTGQLLVFVNVVWLSIKKRPFETEQKDLVTDKQVVAEKVVPQLSTPAESESGHSISAAEVEKAAHAGLRTSLTPVESIPMSTMQSVREAPAEQTLGTQPLSDAGPAPVPGTAQEASLPEQLGSPRAPGRVNVKDMGPLSRPAALVAAAVLLLVAFAMFWPRHRGDIHQTRSAPSGNTTPGVSAAKPSAYGTPVPLPGATLGGADATSSRPSGMFAGQQSSSASAGDAESATPSADVVLPRNDTPGLLPSSESGTPLPRPAGSVEVAPLLTRPTGRIARDPFSLQHGGRKGLYTVSSGMMTGNLISAPSPDYPVLARLTRVEGQVIMQAVVSRNGRVVATHVLQGHHLLRGAAEHAVRSWRYRPYIVNGHPTDVETIVFVNFQLHR